MKCMHINIRKATFILLTILINRIQMEDQAQHSAEDHSSNDDEIEVIIDRTDDVILQCPSNVECSTLNGSCLKCDLKEKCIYGETVNTTCAPEQGVSCNGPQTFPRTYICRYCYQTEHWEHDCDYLMSCSSVASPRSYYISNCTVNDDILCLGSRSFKKKRLCNWTGGYRWSTALALSITLGGFGADRFYLGHWQEGIGKLFSFGGLGVWTIIDVILISLHYLGPADGSLYI